MADAVYESFDTREGFQAAVERLLERPGRELRIFDPDGAALRLNDAARVARLEAFLRANRTRRLYLVLHEPQHLQRDCPRMMSLITRYGACHPDQPHARGDPRAAGRLPRARFARLRAPAGGGLRYRGAIGLGDETEALAMRARFGEIWAASFPAVSGTTVGL